jgi:LacI family transcriptional regulator
VSVSTVDRALHDRPGIKSETRARVLGEAKALDYRPNLAASYLRPRRPLHILVYLPERPASFWDTLRDGLREAATPLARSIRLVFRTYAAGWTGDGLLARPGQDGYDSGLIVAPDDAMASALRREDVRRRDVPMACVGNDMLDSPRIPSVYVEPFTVGALAGELMGRFVPSGGKVAIVTASANTRDHLEQVRGFASSLSRLSTRVKLAAVVETRADDRYTNQRIRELLNAHPRLKGLYISTSDALPVLRAIGHHGGLAAPAMIATDLSPELIPWIRSGKVAASVYQRPLTQAHMVLQLLYSYLQSRVLPTPHRQEVAPYAVMNSNLDIVLQRLAIARAATVSTEPVPSVSAL